MVLSMKNARNLKQTNKTFQGTQGTHIYMFLVHDIYMP
jgi:hypothetical protein